MARIRSPFSGMDPYLEGRWSDVHAKLIGFMGGVLQVQLPPGLRARAEERVLLEEERAPAGQYRADVVVVDTGGAARTERVSRTSVATVDPVIVQHYRGPVIDRFIHILDVTSGNRVVTAIEILSPWNKGPGRLSRDYLRKLGDYARREVSVVEIDLLRYPPRGRLLVTEGDIPLNRRAPYLTCVRRAWAGHQWEVYPMPLREPLPTVPIPLRESDADIGLGLQPLIDRVYEEGAHDDIDYSRPPDPPLEGDDAAWADQVLRSAGRR